MGIDAWGRDKPFWAIKEEFAKGRDRRILLSPHRAGIGNEYCHIEKLVNLDKLTKPFGIKVACLLIKLKGGRAGLNRVVAIIED